MKQKENPKMEKDVVDCEIVQAKGKQSEIIIWMFYCFKGHTNITIQGDNSKSCKIFQCHKCEECVYMFHPLLILITTKVNFIHSKYEKKAKLMQSNKLREWATFKRQIQILC